MIPSSFKYHAPQTIDQAINLLAQYGDDAKILAGGHSLIPAIKLRLNSPDRIIDIGRISELRFIRQEAGHIVIGAGSTHHEIASSDMIRDKIAMVAEAGGMIGDPMVRNVGTIGGSLAHADPAADWPAIMLAAEANFVIQGPGGQRTVAAADFFEGLFMTKLADNELLTEIHIPIPPANTQSTYLKFTQPASRFALVGCAAMVTKSNGTCDRVRVAFSGVSAKPFRDSGVEAALEGQAGTADTITAAADKAAAGVSLLNDHFASQSYRQHLAKVYARRSLSAVAG